MKERAMDGDAEQIVNVAVEVSHITGVVVNNGEDPAREAIIESIFSDIESGHGGLRAWLEEMINKTEIVSREDA